MDINLFDFHLPSECIAQKPLKNRQDSKMMVVNRNNNTIEHKNFCDIIDYLNKDDVLVLNNTRVISARIKGINIESNGKMEMLLVRNVKDNIWEIMCKPGKRALIGKKFLFGDGKLEIEIIDIKDDGNRIAEFKFNGNIYEILNEIGEVPLPPYIKEKLNDSERYQTVYSDKIGSIAAPTAGLHFTDNLLNEIKLKGMKIVYITLHVGLGTFMPVKVNDLNEHKMHSEYYEIKKEVVDIINVAKKNGNRVISVGTTTMRTLETVASKSDDGLLFESYGYTDIFIKPGYNFKIVDSLITNFHLPKSTLLILISAFYDRNKILDAYSEAILNGYRFFSFGDSMFII